MHQKDIVSQHIGGLLCRSDISVTNMLGIQSQFLRYAKWVAKVRGKDLDAEPDRYFRAWTLRGTMHIHEMRDYDLYMHEGNRSPYMKAYWDDHSVVSHQAYEELYRQIDEIIGEASCDAYAGGIIR